MDELDFTEEEIREQLEKLGYHDVSESRLREFKKGKNKSTGTRIYSFEGSKP